KYQMKHGGAGIAAQEIQDRIYQNIGPFKTSIKYDWATYDLFPAFKFDFRPVAETLQRFAERTADRDGPPGNACSAPAAAGFWNLVSKPIRYLASILRNIPFMNTDREQTRTIGHLDPPRPPMGNLTNKAILPFRPLGTTHELLGNSDQYELPVNYSEIATSPNVSFPSAAGWFLGCRKK